MKGEPPLRFDPERPARWGVLPRHGGNADVRWFETPACYMFHSSNAWDDGDAVVLTGCRMQSTDVLQGASANDDEIVGKMHRWRFDLATGEIEEQPLDDRGSDFARVNEALQGRPTRFSFNARWVSEPSDVPVFDGVIKYDQDTGRAEHHEYGPGRFGGEPVFAPRPGSTDEDDGWLLTYVHDERENTDELVVIDARNVGAEPVARVRIPTRVPYGFHATWVEGSRFQR